MAVLPDHQSFMTITAWPAEQYMAMLHPVISSAAVMINLKLGLSYLTWTLASLGLLRLTHHCCIHLSLVLAVQMSANQVPALSGLAVAAVQIPCPTLHIVPAALGCLLHPSTGNCGHANFAPEARLLCACKRAWADRYQHSAHMSMLMLICVITMLMNTYSNDALLMSSSISKSCVGDDFQVGMRTPAALNPFGKAQNNTSQMQK